MYNTSLWHSIWKSYCDFCCRPALVGIGTHVFWRQKSMAVFSSLCLLLQISLKYLANRRRHLLFVKFSSTLNLANLVNHWKPTSWMLKVLLLDSKITCLPMIRDRKGQKTLFFFVYIRTVEIPHRSLVVLIFRLIHLSYSQEKPSKVWTEERQENVAELFPLFYLEYICFSHPVIYIKKEGKKERKKGVHKHFGSLEVRVRYSSYPTYFLDT